jgi:hypothetical protein
MVLGLDALIWVGAIDLQADGEGNGTVGKR